MQRPSPEQATAAVEKNIGHSFRNKGLIIDALTHSSTGKGKNYERLEFLGDRVLGLVVAETLFKKFPNESEGDLAKRLAALVEGSLLAEIANNINIGAYVSLSEAERNGGGQGNEHILADVFEALIGAVYLDAGLDPCRKIILTHWQDRFDKMAAPPSHPKTSVQEWAQGQGLPLPEYTVIEQKGPDHAPVFTVRLDVKGHQSVKAEGRSRQVAEKEAARLFLESVGK